MTRRPYVATSHESFSHDSIDSLGYDWERMADPGTHPRYPLKVYLPRTTEDVVAAILEAKELGQDLKIRSKGHSSNDLVLADRGAVLCTQKMDRILGLDEGSRTVRVQAGAITANLDSWLAQRGYGLPVIGDHNDITAGGFASIGGVGPASLRYGMFVDNVHDLEYVTWDGDVRRCGRAERRDEFLRLLAGTGQYGVITEMTLEVVQVDKYGEVLANNRSLYRNFDHFLEESARFLSDPGDVRLSRGFWLDLGGGKLKVGQLSLYGQAEQSIANTARNKVSYRYLHSLGYVAGRLPRRVDAVVKLLGVAGMVYIPTRASIKNVETFSDKVLDASVGDPTRWFIALVPSEVYPVLFPKLYALFTEYRKRYRCFTFLSFYIKAIRSDYLTNGGPHRYYTELILLPGAKPEKLTPELLESLVSRIDDLCIEHGAYRYMHTKTVKDPERRRKIDPNTQYAAVQRDSLVGGEV